MLARLEWSLLSDKTAQQCLLSLQQVQATLKLISLILATGSTHETPRPASRTASDRNGSLPNIQYIHTEFSEFLLSVLKPQTGWEEHLSWAYSLYLIFRNSDLFDRCHRFVLCDVILLYDRKNMLPLTSCDSVIVILLMNCNNLPQQNLHLLDAALKRRSFIFIITLLLKI